VPSGDGFTPAQRIDLDRAIRAAETVSRFEFSLYVGHAETESRPFADRLHSVLATPARSVLVMVDPSARLLEIVTGAVVRRDLDDEQVRLAAVTMQTAFGEGDLVGGIKRGIAMLAEAARKPQTLHADQP
jgi:hypothetical protein